MHAPLNDPILYFKSNMDAAEQHLLPGGEAVVFSSRSPDKRTANEDSAALLSYGEHAKVLTVADGMGGARHGEVASRITLESLRDNIAIAAREERLLRSGILSGIEEASTRIKETSPGSGTTIAALEISENSVRPYHVGDSVILVVGQRGKVKLLTVPHSPVGLAVEAGVLDHKEAMHHEDRHIILNYVGATDMRIEMGPVIALAAKDTVIIASDGLVDNLSIAEIVNIIRKGPLTKAVQATAAKARIRMATPGSTHPCKPDDLTIVAYRRR